MDTKNLQELLDTLKAQDGGVVLRVGEKPEAVVLSIEKYNELLVNLATNTSLEALETVAQAVEEINLQTEIKPNILVTGGAGYIGSHTVKLLLEKGYGVVVVDNLVTGNRSFVPPEVPFYELDILNTDQLEAVIVEHNINAIIHFAASLEVAESVEQPLSYLNNNLIGTLSVLVAASKHNIEQIVFSSTAAVYGEQEIIPIKEDAELRPNNPYGHTKMLCEQLLGYFAQFLNLKVTIFRYFNVAGTKSEWGLHDTHANSHLLPAILDVASGKKEIFKVNGTDYNTIDGTCVRDYIHVLDVAEAHIRALEVPTSEQIRVYNIGTGKGMSVKEMINHVAEVTERMIPMQAGERRKGDAAITIADNSKIKSELGFIPQYSEPELLIHTAWESYKSTH
jgi:UDP-glucose 4-epimerase